MRQPACCLSCIFLFSAYTKCICFIYNVFSELDPNCPMPNCANKCDNGYRIDKGCQTCICIDQPSKEIHETEEKRCLLFLNPRAWASPSKGLLGAGGSKGSHLRLGDLRNVEKTLPILNERLSSQIRITQLLNSAWISEFQCCS